MPGIPHLPSPQLQVSLPFSLSFPRGPFCSASNAWQRSRSLLQVSSLCSLASGCSSKLGLLGSLTGKEAFHILPAGCSTVKQTQLQNQTNFFFTLSSTYWRLPCSQRWGCFFLCPFWCVFPACLGLVCHEGFSVVLPQTDLTLILIPSHPPFYAPKAMGFFQSNKQKRGYVYKNYSFFFPYQEPLHHYLVTPYKTVASTVDH